MQLLTPVIQATYLPVVNRSTDKEAEGLVAEHSTPVVSGSEVGIIANPMSGRDIRRVVAQASVFPNTEKTSMVLRIIRAVGALGVERVLLSTDAFGIAAGVLREVRRLRAAPPSARVRLPEIEFMTLPRSTGSATDTTEYARIVAQRCSAAVVVLGGDGTMRAAARGLGDTPMLALSTGTNNTFPIMLEATVAGMALGLIATGRAHAPIERAKVLHVDVARADGTGRHEIALVDVCVNTIGEIGSRAVWKTDSLRELYCTFAESDAIGLSSIPGQIMPTGRTAPHGVAVLIGPSGRSSRTVLAPIAPGLLEPVGVDACEPLHPGVTRHVGLARGTVALDGERELEFGPGDRIGVTLAADGPRVIDVPAVLASECSCCSTIFMNSVAEEIQ
jgi:predicted polyphosphate/ATP-dependent NAD kinase